MENISKKEYTNENINELFFQDLKNHYLKRDKHFNSTSQDLPLYTKYIDKEEEKEDNEKKTPKKYKVKFLRKIVLSLILFILVLGYKYYPENIKNNKVIGYIKDEYSKSYSKTQVIEKAEDICKFTYNKLENIIPENTYNFVVSNYIEKIKPKILDFNIKNVFKQEEVAIAVFNEEDFKINSDEAAPIEEAIAVNSELSLMAIDRDEILSKNINIIQPVYGTITSKYGAREEILDVVAYHTGIDIANSYNTQITSATDGIVTKTEEMNYYYGNNIEIENNGVIFKYAHLNEINVKEGDEIKQGQVIGLMGATGQATGSHLHFEIRINGRTVDPEMILEFK